MPAKHTIKTYVEEGIYHIYNRGVEKRVIFEDALDYKVFLNCLKDALLSPEELQRIPIDVTVQGVSFKGIPRAPKNFNGLIDLLAYCLMPNHFHLLVQQHSIRSIDNFMRSVATRYSSYFNKRYSRVGPLFQGAYKAALVDSDVYLLHLSRYIHRNPLKVGRQIVETYSSYADYIDLRHTAWVKKDLVLASFQPAKLLFLRHTNSYRSFVEYDGFQEDALDSDVIIEDDDL